MRVGWIAELTWTSVLFPASQAQRLGVGNPKPMMLIAGVQTKPVQRLPLLTDWRWSWFKGRNQQHATTKFGQHPDTQTLAQIALYLQIDVSFVCNNQLRYPLQMMSAVIEAWP